MLAVFAAGVATFAQLYSVQGVLPSLSRDLKITEAESALSVSAATLGVAASVLVWSAVADRIGRLPTMKISLVTTLALGLAVSLAPGFEVLMILRLLEGIAMGGIPAATVTYLKEEVVPSHAVLAAGMFVSGNTIGGLIGRMVAGPLSGIASWRAGTLAVSLVAAAATVLFLMCVPRSRGFATARLRLVDGPAFWYRSWGALRSARLLAVYAQGVALMGGLVAVFNYVGFRLEAPPIALPAVLTSLVFLAYLPGTWSARWSSRPVRRYGRPAVLLAAIATMALGLAVTLFDWLPSVMLGLAIFTAAFCVAHSVLSGWAPALSHDAPAQAASFYALSGYLGGALIGWTAGFAFSGFGWIGLAAGVVGVLLIAAVIAYFGLARQTTGEVYCSRRMVDGN
jgi:MFS transporter, YNFM family, putative membrane transport protein